MQIPIVLDRSRSSLLVEQITTEVRDAIRQARIAPGRRLPSSRRLADQLDVARNTVVRAYERLLDEGYLESRPSSGYYAAQRPPAVGAGPDRHAEAGDTTALPPPPRAALYEPQEAPTGPPVGLDFRPGRVNPSLFPLKTWRRLLQASLAHGGALGLSGPGDPAGLPALRAAIASHLAITRGIPADPGRIIVTAGLREGIALAARLCLGEGTRAIVETPGLAAAARIFAAEGAQVAEVAVDRSGLRVEDLPEAPTTLLFVTPAHQFPTGQALSEARRRALIGWARRQGCLLLEGDVDGDFRHEGSPPPALAALAPDGVLHLGSFALTLGAGLRLGYMVVPQRFAAAFRGAKALADGGQAWLDQATLAALIDSGSYAAHLTRLRQRIKESRDALTAALRRSFGPPRLDGANAGLHLVWHLPPGLPDAGVIAVLGRRAGVGVHTLVSAGGHEAIPSGLGRRALMLGYAALSPKQIELGVARLSDAIDDAVDEQLVPVDDLFGATLRPRAGGGLAPAAGGDLVPRSRQQPALRIVTQRRPNSAPGQEQEQEGYAAMATVTGMYRYPIKGLSPQPLAKLLVEAGKPFPMDRIFALARPGAPIDPERPAWAKKGLFVMLMLEEGLARVKTCLDVETMRLSILEGNTELMSADLEDAAERSAVEDFFLGLVPTLRAPPRLVRSAAGHFMDKPDNVISLINLATLRSLEEQWGYGIDPLRFRANLYVDGIGPWEEFDWIDREIRIGDAAFRVDRRNGRCGATNVNPQNGRRDLDIPGSLRASFGHKNLGVYLLTTHSGRIAVGDPVVGLPGERPSQDVLMPVPPPAEGARRFMCRGCYFIYDERQGWRADGLAPGTPFGLIAADWRCPDCGSEKSIFRPYVAERQDASA